MLFLFPYKVKIDKFVYLLLVLNKFDSLKLDFSQFGYFGIIYKSK